jgi:hypothetical protein
MTTFPFRDPEIQIQMQELREVQAGKKRPEETGLPRGTRIVGKTVVLPGSDVPVIIGSIIGIIFTALISFAAIHHFISIAATQFAKPTPSSFVIAPVLALGLGCGLYYLREHYKHIAYSVVEIGFGMATAAQVLNVEGTSFVRVLAFLAGVHVIIEGIKRF